VLEEIKELAGSTLAMIWIKVWTMEFFQEMMSKSAKTARMIAAIVVACKPKTRALRVYGTWDWESSTSSILIREL